MKRLLLSTTLAVLGLYILDGATAMANECVWTGGTADWTVPGNWATCAGVAPGLGDFVKVPTCGLGTNIANCPTVPTGAQNAGTLLIAKDATVNPGAFALTVALPSGLTIEDGGTLDVSAPAGSVVLQGIGEHLIDGELILRTFLDLNASTLQIEATLDLGGSGAIIGEHDSALIQIVDPGAGETRTLKLRPELKIEGALKIQGAVGNGTEKFVNDGTVNAGDRGGGGVQKVVTFAVEVTVEGHGEFRVGEFSNTDKIDFFDTTVTATVLNADFSILDGILDINTPFATSGHMYMRDGVIQCDPNPGQCIFAGR